MTLEDRKQRENLIGFDRILKQSTGELAGLLNGVWAVMVFIDGFAFIYTEVSDGWASISYIFMVVWMVNFILAPYSWSNESFSKRNQKMDSVWKILRYIPISERNYIRVRMQILWRFVWKLAAVALVTQLIVMLVNRSFWIGKTAAVVLLFMVIPMIMGYIELKGVFLAQKNER